MTTLSFFWVGLWYPIFSEVELFINRIYSRIVGFPPFVEIRLQFFFIHSELERFNSKFNKIWNNASMAFKEISCWFEMSTQHQKSGFPFGTEMCLSLCSILSITESLPLYHRCAQTTTENTAQQVFLLCTTFQFEPNFMS